MFDLRYHVASLAAVFLALIIGILVGVGISSSGLVEGTERSRLNLRIDELQRDLDAERQRASERQAASEFMEGTYQAVMDRRLDGKQIGIVFVGSVGEAGGPGDAVDGALRDADAGIARVRALTVPLRMEALQQALASRPALAGYAGEGRLADLGRDLGRELVDGGETPLWNALTSQLVEERRGGARRPLDGVVVVRSAGPQRDETARFLTGFYEGLGGSVPVVGAEVLAATPSAVPVFRRAGFSSVDDVDTVPGKVALAVVLAGGRPGHYGLKETAEAIMPPIEPLVPAQ